MTDDSTRPPPPKLRFVQSYIDRNGVRDVARHKSKTVTNYWYLLQEMQRLINCGAAPNAAAVKLAKKHWHSVSRNAGAATQWFKYNQRLFRKELENPPSLHERLVERNARLDLENPNWREELHEENLRNLEAQQEASRRWDEEHPEELEKRRRAAEERARRIELWHQCFKDDPERALAELIDKLKRSAYDD